MHSVQCWGHTYTKTIIHCFSKIEIYLHTLLSGNPEGGFECSQEARTIWVIG